MNVRWNWFFLLALLFSLTAMPLSAQAAVPFDAALQARLATAAPGELVEVIVGYAAPPDALRIDALRGLGLAVVPFRRLPLAAAIGLPDQIRTIASLPGVDNVYLNQPLEPLLHESVNVIGAAAVHTQYGLTGAGVGVAVVDTGIDATHPDLAYGTTTVQNVKMLGLQYAAGVNLNQLQLPVFQLENQVTTDTSSGHGTHVAGIVAASGAASDGYHRGVAPGASLIGLGAGDVLEIFTALASFEYILENQARYNIRVVNNSWGNIVPGFDPQDPVNRATKILHDAGITVVFAAGNSGSATDTLNTYSVAPWVIGVAAGDKDGRSVSFFSSRGIPGDDLFHPTLTAPGYLIVSDRSSTGAYVNAASAGTDPIYVRPEHLVYYTAANGTSMAAPHVAGTVALMLQARADLTPDVIKRVLVNSATPMAGFQEYAAGAGYLNAKAAVETARAIKHIRKYRDPRTGREEQVYDLTERWTGTVNASLPGIASSDNHTLQVASGTRSLEVTIDWDVIANDLNLYVYNPNGQLVAKSEVIQAVYNYANETVHIDNPVAGLWRVEVRGLLNAPQNYKATSNAVVAVNP
jgi:serine protease AprX